MRLGVLEGRPVKPRVPEKFPGSRSGDNTLNCEHASFRGLKAELAEAIRINPKITSVRSLSLRQPLQGPPALVEGLRKAGLPDE
jgi:hypothetical protein